MRAAFYTLAFIALLVPSSASAQSNNSDAASVQQFFAGIYRNYHHNGKGVDPLSAAGAKIFDASFRRLMRADVIAAGPGQVGVLDFDVLCGCQDWDDIVLVKVTTSPDGTSRIRANVTLLLAPSGSDVRRNLEFVLVRANRGLRIQDFIDRTDPASSFDLRVELQRELAKTGPSAK